MEIFREVEAIRLTLNAEPMLVTRTESRLTFTMTLDEPAALRLMAHVARARQDAWFSRAVFALLKDALT